MNRHVWAGLYTSRLDPREGNYKTAEIINQVAISRKDQPSEGNIHFSFKALGLNQQNIAIALDKGPYAHQAFAPESPWLGDKQPRSPRVVRKDGISFEVSKPDQFMAICFGTLKDPSQGDEPSNIQWSYWQSYHSGDRISFVKAAQGPIAAVTFSNTGIASEPTIQPTSK